MDATRGSISSNSTQSTKDGIASLSEPFVLRHGRRCLRNVKNYPLPCDLPELQRQNLSTLLAASILGQPLGSTVDPANPPKKILEIACGSGYWSSICHDYLSGLGYDNVSFTGLDIVPLAGDLQRQGLDWKFVQHDLRNPPLPFSDGEFDIVMLRDLSVVIPLEESQTIIDESTRVLRSGGTLEVWDSDHTIRSILPHPPPPPGRNQQDYARALATGTFLISPSTPFTKVQNKYLQDTNNWIAEALDRCKLLSTPCTRISGILVQETEALCDVTNRRVAIPLGELRWEREAAAERNHPGKRRDSETTMLKKGCAASDNSALTEEQRALRYTALLLVIQLIESLEPRLKEVSGKNQEEWRVWWGYMMADLLEQKGASSGECLEIGVWWCKRV
ncbi:hypothetical protein P153DRAFT_366457 [Dothidotthia symphoricarpi CBS 119687]|uniref:Methyltransferase domain-containing protein n=1 Tax=Dothidotthia symphoricarpi CBS 119687 TaxID=1392245 RepID=A0A6A6AHR2_9PLEO|nr:uncharacterized protein P153DRAFT_366457 [Dothidotthia symphoricarpi CBS 119687]KAF2129971.1 hypothetical protein P153DRAFT_366457 [Dothidotthia symphoricarpi CBS 119687]